MPTACTPLWEFIALVWTSQITRWLVIPWRQCAAQRRCYWWCLCCNFWLCFIGLVLLVPILVAILLSITIIPILIVLLCEFLCILSKIGPSSGTCFVFSSTSGNRPPTASAGGPYSGRVGAPVSMSAMGSTDPDGNALTASWAFGDGASGSGMNVTHIYGSVGVFTVDVTVSDGTTSASASTTANIVLIDPTGGPIDNTNM